MTDRSRGAGLGRNGFAFRLLLCILFAGILSGCAPSMMKPDTVTWAHGQVALRSLFERPSGHAGERTILGGVILGIKSREGQTTLRLLAYPLDHSYYPDTRRPPLGQAWVLWTGPQLSTLFIRGNRIAVAGTVLPSDDSRTLRIGAQALSPDTCLSYGGYLCRRTAFGCSCHQ